ncbi:hypothetical protein [Desulforamulus aquiferis]|uniref:Uncharacterized protein n=1 Tax=Desulforamulus aquiferis TaxID=1397668 RepID=A0AAW7ZF27_9FIRM|nr:hypothetical protein [Desulforamulus aquiferis]MDO7787899.1 hypothetical protein [Desulforamulus aquiferis]
MKNSYLTFNNCGTCARDYCNYRVIEETLVIVIDRKTGEEKKRYLINERTARKSLDEYIAPAVEYLASVIKPFR